MLQGIWVPGERSGCSLGGVMRQDVVPHGDFPHPPPWSSLLVSPLPPQTPLNPLQVSVDSWVSRPPRP